MLELPVRSLEAELEAHRHAPHIPHLQVDHDQIGEGLGHLDHHFRP